MTGIRNGQPNGEEAAWTAERRAMVEQLRAYGLTDERILAAMARVRRHAFIPDAYRRHGSAYGDHPLPIGHGQTLSQPFIVAHMIAALEPEPGNRVLEIGAGSGYQAAVLAELGLRVFTVEIVPALAEHARAALAREGYADRVEVRLGDGSRGWPERAPFDALIGACAASAFPDRLTDQLRDGGRLIFPVCDGLMGQRLVIARRRGARIEKRNDLRVIFVPLVGADGQM